MVAASHTPHVQTHAYLRENITVRPRCAGVAAGLGTVGLVLALNAVWSSAPAPALDRLDSFPVKDLESGQTISIDALWRERGAIVFAVRRAG